MLINPISKLSYNYTNKIYKLKRNPSVEKVKAVILDWSGTTADPFVIAPARVFADVFQKHNVPITMKEAREPMGLRKDLHIAKILQNPDIRKRWFEIKGYEPTQKDVDELFVDFVPMQLSCLREYTGLLPGVADTIKKLQISGIKIGSTTGFLESMVDILLEDAKKQNYIPDSSVAGDQVSHNMGFRPAPFMVYENLKQLGIYPIKSVVKVDDTISGVGEGINAGCWAVGVCGWSNYMDIDSMEQWNNMSDTEKEERRNMSKNKLIYESNAHYVIDDLTFLPTVIDDINLRLQNGETP